ncbi:MAG: pyruvate ferredoxin oxidoreductase [archaeon]
MKKQLKVMALTGCESAAVAIKQINPGVFPAYPITPSSEIMEWVAKFKVNNEFTGELVLAESEHSALSIGAGASSCGVRVMTATDAQGLLYMYEVLPVVSGSRLPIIMNIANRAISAPANIHCDHADSMTAKNLGWLQVYCETAQEVYENNFLMLKVSENEKVLLPSMIMQDGFLTSGNLVKVKLLEDKKVKKFIGEYKAKQSLLDFKNNYSFGCLKLADSYFETKMQEKQAMEEAGKIYLAEGKKLSKITGHNYPYFEEFYSKNAKAVIVTMSSTAGTVKDVVEKMRKKGKKVGLIKINLFRPFPFKELAKALKNAESIGVLDRNLNYGCQADIVSDVKNALFDNGMKKNVLSVVFGVGGRDFFSFQAERIFELLLKGRKGEIVVGVR